MLEITLSLAFDPKWPALPSHASSYRTSPAENGVTINNLGRRSRWARLYCLWSGWRLDWIWLDNPYFLSFLMWRIVFSKSTLHLGNSFWAEDNVFNTSFILFELFISVPGAVTTSSSCHERSQSFILLLYFGWFLAFKSTIHYFLLNWANFSAQQANYCAEKGNWSPPAAVSHW